MKRGILVTAAVALLAASVLVAAEKATPPVTSKPAKRETGPKVDAVEAVSLARSLSIYGKEHKSPEVLVAAARILIDNPTRPWDLKPTIEPMRGAPEKPETVKPVEHDLPKLDAKALLDLAKALAAGNEAILAVIKALEAQLPDPTRGPVGGPKEADVDIQPLSQARAVLTFKGGEVACVSVVGCGCSDLDLYVYDSLGNLVGCDDDDTDICLVYFTPRQTANYTIVVVNVGLALNEATVIVE